MVKFADKTDPNIDVNKLIEQLKTKEIEFSYVEQLGLNRKISGHDFAEIYIQTQDPGIN